MTRKSETVWRPTADSMRNLALFWAAIGSWGSLVALVSADPSARAVIAVVLGAAMIGGWIVAVVWSRPRVLRALEAADKPRLRNWPADDEARAAAERAGWTNAARVGSAGAAIGALAGLVPVLGAGVAASGVAGAIGTVAIWRTVLAFEADHEATVLTEEMPKKARRAALHFGVVARQP